MENLKEETIEKIKEVQNKIKESENDIEKMMIKHHELNPLIFLFGEIILKEKSIL